MKHVMLAIMLLIAVALSGCSSSAGSAGLGALGGGRREPQDMSITPIVRWSS